MYNRRVSFAFATILVLMLAGCGSMGGLGGVLGNPSNSSATIQGTVNYVDTRAQTIDLTSSNGQRNTIYYNTQTRVTHQGQSGSPSQLERGDQIDVRAYANGNGQYTADTITVTQSVSSNGNYPNTYPNTNPNTYPSNQANEIYGTVNSVDTQSRRIDITGSYGNGLRNSQNNTYTVYYDNRTQVTYQGRTYTPADLERGDQVDVRVFDNGGRQYMADTITVTRNVRQ